MFPCFQLIIWYEAKQTSPDCGDGFALRFARVVKPMCNGDACLMCLPAATCARCDRHPRRRGMCWAARPWCWQPQRRCRMCRRTTSPPSWLRACSLKRRRLVAGSGKSLLYSFIAFGSWRATPWHQGLPLPASACQASGYPGAHNTDSPLPCCSEVTGSFSPCRKGGTPAGDAAGAPSRRPSAWLRWCCGRAAPVWQPSSGAWHPSRASRQ